MKILSRILWFGPAVLVVPVSFIVALKAAMWSSPDPYAIGIVSVWVAVVPIVFIPTLVLSGYLVAFTFRSSEANKYRWKHFWNFVDALWLIAAGLGIFATLAAGAIALAPVVDKYYQGEIAEKQKKLPVLALNSYNSICHGPGRSDALCVHLESFIKQPGPFVFPEELARYFRQTNLSENDRAATVELRMGLMELGEDMKFENLEAQTSSFPGWATWLAIFAPHLFAFVFPLRLGRAIAVFRL